MTPKGFPEVKVGQDVIVEMPVDACMALAA